jgi:hypothetical protein
VQGVVHGQGRHRALGRELLGPGPRRPRNALCAKLNPNVVPGDTLRLVEAIMGYSTRLTISIVPPTIGLSALMAQKTTEVRMSPSAGRKSSGGSFRKLGPRKLVGAGGAASPAGRLKAGRFQEAVGAHAVIRKVFSTF